MVKSMAVSFLSPALLALEKSEPQIYPHKNVVSFLGVITCAELNCSRGDKPFLSSDCAHGPLRETENGGSRFLVAAAPGNSPA